MSDSDQSHANKCCSMEKRRLMEDIQKCDSCSTSWKAHHRCLRGAAKRSGRRSRSCMTS